MSFLQILILAVIQGLAELLPVSSSAHVIVAEKLMGLDPTTPEMTLLLLMLHTGTMFSVLFYFWGKWEKDHFASGPKALAFGKQVLLATLATGILGFGLKFLIEKVFLKGSEVEDLFGNLKLISVNLFAVGLLILYASAREKKVKAGKAIIPSQSILIGLVQGLCLPLRGFSRSGATISTGLLLGMSRLKAEDFSFALALVLTPPLLLKEAHRLLEFHAFAGLSFWGGLELFYPGLLGMIFSFIAGLAALRWLSDWLTRGKWNYFGFYCLAFAAVVFWLSGRF